MNFAWTLVHLYVYFHSLIKACWGNLDGRGGEEREGWSLASVLGKDHLWRASVSYSECKLKCILSVCFEMGFRSWRCIYSTCSCCPCTGTCMTCTGCLSHMFAWCVCVCVCVHWCSVLVSNLFCLESSGLVYVTVANERFVLKF